MKNRSKSTFIGSNESVKVKPKTDAIGGMIEEEKSASSRAAHEEKELKYVNEGYTNANAEPESQNIANMLKQGVKATKPGAQPADRHFTPFKSPFTEEIINTSKEIVPSKTVGGS